MTDDTLNQHATLLEEQTVTVKTVLPASSVSPALKPASKPAGPAKSSTRVDKFMRNPRWPIIAGSLMLLLAIVFSAAYNFASLFKPAKAPLIVTMITSYSGQNPSQGLEAWRSAKLYIDLVNQQENGVDGHQITLEEKNDKTSGSDESIAEGIAQSRSLLMLGPIFSSMVLQPHGKELYKDTPIPLITASVSYDALTTDNPFAFRLRTITSSQGKNSATYVYQVLNLKTASILSLKGDSAYGQPVATTFATTFQNQGGHIAQNLQIDQSPKDISTTLVHDPGIIFLAMTNLQTAHDVIVNLRTNGVTAPILCSDAIDSDLFPTFFSSDEKKFTDGIYASAPVIYDSAPDAAQTFAHQYYHTYNSMPGWFGAKYYDAAQVAVQALRNAHVQGTPASLNDDRMSIKNQLENMTSSQNGVEGLDGMLYFDKKNRNEGISQTRFGQFWHGRLRSLPTQLVAISDPKQANQPGQTDMGETIEVDNQYFQKQRVVYAGIDLNSIRSINITSATFSVDFYLWMRYLGSDDATDIAFTNANNISFDPTQPQSSQIVNDTTLPLSNQPGDDQHLHYRRYHITGDFKTTYDFHEYPFDQQLLNIGFQNTHITSEHLVYVIDTPGLGLQVDNTAPSSVATAFQSLSSWTYLNMQYASDTFSSRSTLGDPQLFDQRTQTNYSGLQVTMTIQRKALAYLISHLLPLILLMLLVYASLFLPLDKYLGDRLALTVSALLASAVLLLSINSELPDIGYVVSLDYIYYTFFVLCLLCTVVPMFMEWLQEQKHENATRSLNIGLHSTYVVVLIITISYYLIAYSGRLAW